MAKINKQEVIQKLVDELNLYPGKDIIPTELADKILAVYQINTEDITVNIKPTYYLWQDAAEDDSDKTMTVPSGHTYIIKFGNVTLKTTASAGDRRLRIEIKDAAGNVIWAAMNAAAMVASKTYELMFSSNAYKAYEGIYTYYSTMPIPSELVLKEGYTMRIWDSETIDVAADDMVISFMVEDITD